MADKPDDICPRPDVLPPQPTQPLVPPLYTAAVYRCESIEQADAVLGGQLAGYAYVRDGHPNADLLAEKCRELHGAERAAICSSGMGALAVAVLSQLAAGRSRAREQSALRSFIGATNRGMCATGYREHRGRRLRFERRAGALVREDEAGGRRDDRESAVARS